MDADKIQEQSKELAEIFTSIEASGWDYAINRYFESNATFTHELLTVTGASKIKKVVNLGQYSRATPGTITQQPHYDASRQVITFGNKLDYNNLQLPAWIPLASSLSGGKKYVREWRWTAHLSPNTDEEGDGGAKGQKLFITKLEGQGGATILNRLVPSWILKPVIGFLVLFAASVIAFSKAHSKETPVQLVFSAAIALFNAFWGALLTESSKRQAQAEQWRSEKGPQFKQYYTQAYTSALDISAKVQSDLEARAKAAGIPVDDYKQRAAQAISDLTENVEARAKAAGLPVDEYKKQAEALIEELKRRAGEVAGYVEEQGKEVKKGAEDAAQETRKRGSGVKKQVQKKADQLTQDNTSVNGHSTNGNGEVNPEQRAKEIQAEFAQTPRTPLGGHDPTAEGAPSFAAAAAS